MHQHRLADDVADDPAHDIDRMLGRPDLEHPGVAAARAGELDMGVVEPHDEDLGLDRTFDIVADEDVRTTVDHRSLRSSPGRSETALHIMRRTDGPSIDMAAVERGRGILLGSIKPQPASPLLTTETHPPEATTTRPIEISFPIAGMTCASCVNRIERFLDKTPGVESSSVNLATEIATVRYQPAVAAPADLVSAIEAAGYELKPQAVGGSPDATTLGSLDEAADREAADRARELRYTLIQSMVALATAVGIMVLMFWPQTVVAMEAINKFVLWPATFIQFWAGARFYRAAWRAGRHGTATMDTLVVVGTTAAWAYSVFVTMYPEFIHQAGLHPETYFDSSTIILGLILLGRWLEGRAKGQTTGAIRRLIGLQARTARVVRGSDEIEVPLEQVLVGDLLRVRPGDKVPVDGIARRRRVRGRRIDADR